MDKVAFSQNDGSLLSLADSVCKSGYFYEHYKQSSHHQTNARYPPTNFDSTQREWRVDS